MNEKFLNLVQNAYDGAKLRYDALKVLVIDPLPLMRLVDQMHLTFNGPKNDG